MSASLLFAQSDQLWNRFGFRRNYRTSCEAAPSLPPPPPPPGSVSPPPPPSAETSSDTTTSKDKQNSDAIAAAAAQVTGIPNPGQYETASHAAGKGLVSLDTYDGFRCDISKRPSPYFNVVHSFMFGTTMLPDRNKMYTFIGQVADESKLLMARVDPEKQTVDGRVHMNIEGLALLKLQLSLAAPAFMKPDDAGGAPGQGGGESNETAMAELDFGGETWTGNLKYGSMGNGIMCGCNYFQSITSKLALGGEGMYIGANNSLLSSYSAKYEFSGLPSVPSGEDTSITKNEGSATLLANYNTGQGVLSMNYKRVVTPDRVTLGAELQCSPQTLDSQVLVGAEVKLEKSKINLCVDGTGKIQSLLEAQLGMGPESPTLTLSADVDLGKDAMKFGYGLNVGG